MEVIVLLSIAIGMTIGCLVWIERVNIRERDWRNHFKKYPLSHFEMAFRDAEDLFGELVVQVEDCQHFIGIPEGEMHRYTFKFPRNDLEISEVFAGDFQERTKAIKHYLELCSYYALEGEFRYLK